MSQPIPPAAADLLHLWFGDPADPASGYGQPRQDWFQKSAQFDEVLRDRFGPLQARAAAGELESWQHAPRPCLALLLLLDQLPRNLFRGQPESFATDPQARAVAHHALAQGFDAQLLPVERTFLYLPLEHSETLADQQRSVALFEKLSAQHPELASYHDYALRHQDVIARFGRFPHRNEVLGRDSTPAEVAFLQQPGSRF